MDMNLGLLALRAQGKVESFVQSNWLNAVYIAEASLLTNMEQCSSSPDLDHIMDGLRRLAVYEADIQRRLFCHGRLISFCSRSNCYHHNHEVKSTRRPCLSQSLLIVVPDIAVGITYRCRSNFDD
ncbi:hypothetical protein TELCIR_10002 [Teladorsagia circumcincta]|uniref:Uncharacterized protein n=1 Tax=Teladorsagia circumcincta TaxID=45464 RepID=A0A2G9UD96_TELCI|nr:hypothetical protein TELCIR_10002 [Teladorsagia circumcincta]